MTQKKRKSQFQISVHNQKKKHQKREYKYDR
jgi:hypothetical protein